MLSLTKSHHRHADLIMTSILVVLTLRSWISYMNVTVVYAAVVIFVNFICPWILIKVQRFKSEIRGMSCLKLGPWDEAKITTR